MTNRSGQTWQLPDGKVIFITHSEPYERRLGTATLRGSAHYYLLLDDWEDDVTLYPPGETPEPPQAKGTIDGLGEVTSITYDDGRCICPKSFETNPHYKRLA